MFRAFRSVLGVQGGAVERDFGWFQTISCCDGRTSAVHVPGKNAVVKNWILRGVHMNRLSRAALLHVMCVQKGHATLHLQLVRSHHRLQLVEHDRNDPVSEITCSV